MRAGATLWPVAVGVGWRQPHYREVMATGAPVRRSRARNMAPIPPPLIRSSSSNRSSISLRILMETSLGRLRAHITYHGSGWHIKRHTLCRLRRHASTEIASRGGSTLCQCAQSGRTGLPPPLVDHSDGSRASVRSLGDSMLHFGWHGMC